MSAVVAAALAPSRKLLEQAKQMLAEGKGSSGQRTAASSAPARSTTEDAGEAGGLNKTAPSSPLKNTGFKCVCRIKATASPKCAKLRNWLSSHQSGVGSLRILIMPRIKRVNLSKRAAIYVQVGTDKQSESSKINAIAYGRLPSARGWEVVEVDAYGRIGCRQDGGGDQPERRA